MDESLDNPPLFLGCELSKPIKNLQFLLKRTQRIQTWRPKRRVEPSEHLVFLVKRLEYRRWNIAEINYILNVIREMVGEVKWIQHVQSCDGHDGCMLEIVLSIERYMGSRLPWFLDLRNDITMMLEFEDEDDPPELLKPIRECPHVSDYKIGSYWTGSSPDTIRFIKDRMTWAEKIILKQIRNACKYLRLLIAWDLDPETMPYWEPRVLWQSLEEPHSHNLFFGV